MNDLVERVMNLLHPDSFTARELWFIKIALERAVTVDLAERERDYPEDKGYYNSLNRKR